MNVVHLHLAINHSPLYAELFSLALLLIGLPARKRALITCGLVIAIIAAICGLAAYWTGDHADETIDHSPPIAGVEKSAIGPHEEAAEVFVTASCITAGLAIIGLFIGSRREPPLWVDVVIVLAILVSLLLAARTAVLGGRIHHPEVRAVVNR